jgi:anti-sigma factor RsiW
MTHISVFDERAHLQVWELLPWLVNGTASESERGEVEAHLRDCKPCGEELARQRRAHAQMNAEVLAGPPVEQGIARLLQVIDEQAHPAPRSRRAALTYGLVALVLLQTAGLAVLGTRLGDSPSAPVYRTLSTPERSASQVTIRLVVDETMPAGRLQSLLVPLHLQVVGGPSDNGVYSLGPASAPGDVERQVNALRAAHGVRFVEPVGSGRDAP